VARRASAASSGRIGAGTGLGVSGLIPADGGWVALGTEGGHTSFAPRDEREVGHPARTPSRSMTTSPSSACCRARGCRLIHRALQHRDGLQPAPAGAADHSPGPEQGERALHWKTLEVFCLMLGTAASNLAVTQGAFGGIFIGGGIVPRLGTGSTREPFRPLRGQGPLQRLPRAIPTYVITAEHATLDGASGLAQSSCAACSRRRARPSSGRSSAPREALAGRAPRGRPRLAQPRFHAERPHRRHRPRGTG
jgi:glucokinase